VAAKNFYDLLEIGPTASADEVKRAFRQQIARYHPDKVQHLGDEFQQLAADRAAELTEAYRILSDARRRAEYDGELSGAATTAGSPEAPRRAPASPSGAQPEPMSDGPPVGKGPAFLHERATRDEFVRKAAIGRFRQAIAAVGGDYSETSARGFDGAWLPKSKIFSRNTGPRLVVRFVSRVDGESVVSAWTHAIRWAPDADVCVFLMGAGMASASELASAVAEQRRKAARGRVIVVPVDARAWDAHLPTDAPPVAKTVVKQLRGGG
jgi:hypothetical protein